MSLLGLFSRKGMDDYIPQARELKATIVDVREPDEFASGHVEGAINVPLGSLAELAPQLLPAKDAKLFVHCLSGGRSGRACKQLESMGYTDVTNIGGVGSYHGPLV